MDRINGLTCFIPIQMCEKDVVGIVTFDLARVVQKVDSAIHPINLYSLDNADCPGELTALNTANSASPPLPPSPPRRKSTLLSFFSHTPQNISKIKGGDTATHLRNNCQTLGILTGMALGIGLEGML